MEDAQFLVQMIVEDAKQLGLTWTLRPAIVHDIDIVRASATITLDGDDTPMAAINIIGNFNVGARVMTLIIPNKAVYIIGKLGNFFDVGELVVRIRQETPQTFTTAVQDFINFDTVDYDPLGWFKTGTPDQVLPQIPGWFFCVARVVWAANATSRRLCGINLNGTTSGADGIGVQSLQTPATGTCQIQAAGSGLFDGIADFVGVRGLQNSGGNLDTSSSDGGSSLEIYYGTPGRV